MPSRRPFLFRLATLALVLLTVASLCRSRGVDEDLPAERCITGLIFPVPPLVDWPGEDVIALPAGARAETDPASSVY